MSGLSNTLSSVSSHQLAAGTDAGQVTVEKIRYAVERIVAIADPLRVIAFGSRARGDHHPGSDLDLAIVVDEYDPKQGLPKVRRPDIDVWMTLDLVVYGVARERLFEDTLNTLQYEVKREGVLLYDRADGVIHTAAAESLV